MGVVDTEIKMGQRDLGQLHPSNHSEAEAWTYRHWLSEKFASQARDKAVNQLEEQLELYILDG